MCAWIPHDGNRFDFENTKAAVKVFNEAGAVLKKEGITLAYHAHGYEFRPYEYGTLFDYMAQNAKNFSLEMDVFWITHGGEDPIALLEKYPDFVVMLHLKDMQKGVKGNNTGGENVETNVVLGQGQIDIEGVVRKAHEQGVRYMFIEDESSRVEQQVPQSLKFLKSISLN
jgi:sugar phosphate isomerase/epimerase